MNRTHYFDQFNEMLLRRGSWLYDENSSECLFYDNFCFDLKTFFDPFSSKFKQMSIKQKLLILYELFYCGIEPILLSSIYCSFCKEWNYDELHVDFGQALLEIIKLTSKEDTQSINIHNPKNWYRGKNNSSYVEEAHDAIIMVLEIMGEEFHKRLKKEKNILIRKRLIFTQRTSVLIGPNQDKIFDQIDEELLRRVNSIEPDVKARIGSIRLLAEDIHDELDPKHKEERLALAQLIYKSIETLDLDTLRNLSEFKNLNIDHFVDIKKYPKDWLYKSIYNLALRRDLDKIRNI